MKMFVLGVLAWSLVATLVYAILDGIIDEEVRQVIECGPICWLVSLGYRCLLAGSRALDRVMFRGLMQDQDGNIYWCESSEEFNLLWNYADELNPFHSEEFKEKSARYYPRKVWKNYPRVPDEILQKAKENKELRKDEW